MEYIQVPREEYERLLAIAEKYDFKKLGSNGGRVSAQNMTPEERQERARKAQQASVLARKRNAELKKQAYLSQIAQDAQNIH